jgi:DNA-binding MarR family transcriptional regulator
MPRRSPADRRRVLVDLTTAAQAVLDRVLPERQQLVTAVMAPSMTRPSTPC